MRSVFTLKLIVCVCVERERERAKEREIRGGVFSHVCNKLPRHLPLFKKYKESPAKQATHLPIVTAESEGFQWNQIGPLEGRRAMETLRRAHTRLKKRETKEEKPKTLSKRRALERARKHSKADRELSRFYVLLQT